MRNLLHSLSRPDSLSAAFRLAAIRAELPGVHFHVARHTHASLLLAAGVHPKVVSKRLGHASAAFTLDTYSHVMPGLQEAAAERLDQIPNPGGPLSRPGYRVRGVAFPDVVETGPPQTRGDPAGVGRVAYEGFRDR